MENERETPRPLEAEEIKTGIAQIVADAVYDQLGKTCNLFGVAYPKFKGTVSIHLELDNFGLATIDNSVTNIEGGEGEITAGSVPLDDELEIKEVPPNQFRTDTDQPVTKAVTADGKTTVERVKYKPRPKGKKAASKTVSKKGAKNGKDTDAKA